MLIDARAERRPDMEVFIEEIRALALEVASETGVTIATPVVISDNMPTPMDEGLQDLLCQACDAVGARHRRMASGAGHDAAWMARVTRAAMLFVPCRDGRSHVPEEWADTTDIALGAAVLLETVLKLDQALAE
jgi:N-carbamoyl-L-amino-acid hydrolase